MSQLSPEDLEYSHELHEFAANMRGQFLQGSTWIEMLISDILALYFCPQLNRRSLFFSEIAYGMRFISKVELLQKVISRDFPNFEESYPGLVDRLDTFRVFRNLLAHGHIDTSPEALASRKPDEVTLVLYKAGEPKRRRVTVHEATKQADEANELRGQLLEIQRHLFAINQDQLKSSGVETA